MSDNDEKVEESAFKCWCGQPLEATSGKIRMRCSLCQLRKDTVGYRCETHNPVTSRWTSTGIKKSYRRCCTDCVKDMEISRSAMKELLNSKKQSCYRCNAMVSSDWMDDHIATICPFTGIQCPLCFTTVERSELSNHWKYCNDYKLVCKAPNCGKSMTGKGEIDDHNALKKEECHQCGIPSGNNGNSWLTCHLTVCLMGEVRCPLCYGAVLRKEMCNERHWGVCPDYVMPDLPSKSCERCSCEISLFSLCGHYRCLQCEFISGIEGNCKQCVFLAEAAQLQRS